VFIVKICCKIKTLNQELKTEVNGCPQALQTRHFLEFTVGFRIRFARFKTTTALYKRSDVCVSNQ